MGNEMSHPNSKLTIQERFLAKVNIPANQKECWEWTASKNKDGYGFFRASKFSRAHRVAYELFVGDIPEEMVVAHKCDNPSCVNPSHLWVCQQIDNIRDRDGKERTGRGEKNRHAKLQDKDAIQIKEMIANGKTNTEIAKIFKIDRSVVSKIRHGKVWAFL